MNVLNTDKKQFRGDRIYLAYICRPQATNEGRQGKNLKSDTLAIPYGITTDQGTDYVAKEAGQ